MYQKDLLVCSGLLGVASLLSLSAIIWKGTEIQLIKRRGSTFYWVTGPVSLRGDKEDFPLNPGFANTSFVP